MVASHTGLSDLEMEDVLSLDDEVLNFVYSSFHPKLRRIPPSTWIEVKDLNVVFLLLI